MNSQTSQWNSDVPVLAGGRDGHNSFGVQLPAWTSDTWPNHCPRTNANLARLQMLSESIVSITLFEDNFNAIFRACVMLAFRIRLDLSHLHLNGLLSSCPAQHASTSCRPCLAAFALQKKGLITLAMHNLVLMQKADLLGSMLLCQLQLAGSQVSWYLSILMRARQLTRLGPLGRLLAPRHGPPDILLNKILLSRLDT